MAEKSRQINLTEMAEHLDYEVQMLVWCANKLKTVGEIRSAMPDKWTEDDVENLHRVIFEAFLVHTRNLLYVFFPKSKRKKIEHSIDVEAADYCSDWNERHDKVEAELNKMLKSASFADVPTLMSKISKRLAHLTIDRTEPDREWKYGEIYGALQLWLRQFMTPVPDSNLENCPNLMHFADPQWRVSILAGQAVSTSGSPSDVGVVHPSPEEKPSNG